MDRAGHVLHPYSRTAPSRWQESRARPRGSVFQSSPRRWVWRSGRCSPQGVHYVLGQRTRVRSMSRCNMSQGWRSHGRRRGPRLTAAQKAEVWRRWRHGESLNAIGRALGRIAKVVRYEVARTGGVAPHARHRSRLEGPTRTRMACSASICRRGPTSPATHRLNWIGSRTSWY